MANMLSNHEIGQDYVKDEKSTEGEIQIDDSSTTFAIHPHPDEMRLTMEASVWPLIASRAESLFNFLMQNELLRDSQYRIEKWLAEKKICDELVNGLAPSDKKRFDELMKETLEDVKKDDRSSKEENDNDADDEEDYSDVGSEYNLDILEKLNECMIKFRKETDRIVDSKKDICKESNIEIIETITENSNATNNNIESEKPIPFRNPTSRRNSILPGSEMCKEVLAFNNSLKSNENHILNNKTSETTNTEHLYNSDSGTVVNENLVNCNNNSADLSVNDLEKTKVTESVKKLSSLALENETKQSQIKNIEIDIDGVKKCMDKIKETIRIKESIISDLTKSSYIRENVKKKVDTRMDKLREICMDVSIIILDVQKYIPVEKSRMQREKLRKCCSFLTLMRKYCRKKIEDIETLDIIADDSVKIIMDLQKSVSISNGEYDDLKRQLSSEKYHKKQLYQEVAESQNKIRELVEQCNLTASKLKELQSESEDGKTNKSNLDYCDKEKNLLDVSARISHLDHVLMEKAMDLEGTENTNEKEALRHEIRNLRRTRDCLVDEKCDLDEKFQKEKTLSTVEERKLLECGETIEAIDAMIEHKNEMICGRKCFDENQSQREKGERMLMERLSKLSEGEMRTLFYKYFLKVIDLKESSKNLEVQTAELENHIETQKWQIQTLTNALKQTKVEAEHRIVLMQKEYEQKLHRVFQYLAYDSDNDKKFNAAFDSEPLLRIRHFAGDMSSDEIDSPPKKQNGRSSGTRKHKSKKMNRNTATTLKLPVPAKTNNHIRIPHEEQKQIASSNRSTTKVARQWNKMDESSDDELSAEHNDQVVGQNFAIDNDACRKMLQTVENTRSAANCDNSLKKMIRSTTTTLKLPSPPETTNPIWIPHDERKQIASNNRSTTKVTRQRNKLIIQKTTDTNKQK